MCARMASRSLEAHLDVLHAALLRLGEPVRSQYVPPLLEHYQRVAERLDRLAYNDEVLATAGFCHGAWELVAPDALGAIVGPEVRSVLANWARLKQLPVGELADAVREDPRAAFLCVFDRLDRVDPGDTLVSNGVVSAVLPHSEVSCGDVAAHFLHHAAATAQIAELLGLWAYRKAVEDMALRLEHPDLLVRTTDFIESGSRGGGYPQQYVAAIDALLEPVLGTAESRLRCDPAIWRWRHLARVARSLAAAPADVDPLESPAIVAACGFALVGCDSDDIAYRILGRLHAHATDYDRTRFFDSVGRETKDGYRMVHTAVSVTVRGHTEHVQVRIQPPGQRPRPSEGELLELGLRASPLRRTGHVRVRTPRGEIQELPAGSNVLAFAASLHSGLAAYAVGAFLNHDRERTVDVLHPLRDGDRVELVLGKQPGLPPDRWEEGVPIEIRRRIQHGLRRELATHFRGQGLAWIRKRLTAVGISAEDSILTPLLEWAVVDIPFRRLPRQLGALTRQDWILQQLGIAESFDRGERLPMGPLLSRDEIKLIETKLDEVLAQLHVEHGPTVPEDDTLRQRTRAIRFCTRCNAREVRQHAVHRLRDGTLIVHRRGARCANGAHPLALIDPRFATLNQYFAAETTNRIGIAEEILGVFRGHDVDVTDIAARKLGPGWGIFRVGVGVIGPSKVHTIEAQLQAIPGVQRVRGPGQGPLPILEDWLPARAEYIRLMDPPGRPYQVGGEIVDDRYFYGRTGELGALEKAYSDTEVGPGGAMVLVHGPLKTGKSSLVTHFMRRLQARESDVIALRYVAGEESWISVEQRLCQLLIDHVHEHARDQKLPQPPRLSGDLASMLFAIRRWSNAPRVVLVIDEAVRMLQYMDQAREPDPEAHDGAAHALLRFRNALANFSRVLVVLIGPKAPTLHLGGVLRQFVNSARDIPVRPFSLSDTRALIEAQHLQNIFQISAEPYVFQRAYEDTAGDPFWIAHLADRMWERADREHKVYFESSHFAEARRYIVGADHIFHDRVEPQPGERFDVDRLWRIATMVAQLCGTRDATHGYTTERVLQDELGTAGLVLTAYELAEALDDLGARGAVALSGGALSEGRKIWIAAPVLADNLRETSRRRTAGDRA